MPSWAAPQGLGRGDTIVANIIFSVFIAFFPVLVATIAGLQETPPTFDRLGQ